jgi:hypothetical protein
MEWIDMAQDEDTVALDSCVAVWTEFLIDAVQAGGFFSPRVENSTCLLASGCSPLVSYRTVRPSWCSGISGDRQIKWTLFRTGAYSLFVEYFTLQLSYSK